MRRFIFALLIIGLTTDCKTVDVTMDHKSDMGDWRDEIIYQIVVDRFEDGDWNKEADSGRGGKQAGGEAKKLSALLLGAADGKRAFIERLTETGMKVGLEGRFRLTPSVDDMPAALMAVSVW